VEIGDGRHLEADRREPEVQDRIGRHRIEVLLDATGARPRGRIAVVVVVVVVVVRRGGGRLEQAEADRTARDGGAAAKEPITR